jgi:hypothetical protein
VARGAIVTVVALAVLVGAVLAGHVARAAYTSSTASSGNSFSAGTVALGDDDAGGLVVSLSSARPGVGDVATGCVRVTSPGSLATTVRLYGTVAGSLAQHLSLVVTRGTQGGSAFPSCAGFAPDPADYAGAGAGVVYAGSLSDYPALLGAALVDPMAGAPETWTGGESHVYRFVVSLVDTPAAQGLAASATFHWQGRSP